ncbi:AAA family ATPase [Nostocoides sp. HKS02]|uniref:AAA family ATPase n=1 Tax=Nostocoides sp. HKS02 TaxID=1813880 RepID=UPI0018A8227F|nr:AAA family ATPase [Tetrasphaera sp. HKS02]
MFLIRGATGAGKTSLLDAVAFALFADVPGARSKKGLHSDHADRATVPEVSLEFTVGTRRLRVERSPEFLRPKSRGTGETKVPARAVLSEHRGGHWQALSTRHDEIAEIIQDVLGLGLEQFSKVVLLPQGDFAAFLSASPEQRRTLLERLFDVAPFTGVEEWLALRRKESALDVDRQRAALAAELALLGEVLAASPAAQLAADSDWSEVPLDELPARLDDARARLEGAAAEALAQLDAARLADAAATTAHTTGEELAGARRRLAEAQARVTALESGRADQVAAVSRLDAAGRAFALSGDLKAFERASAAADLATAQLAAAESGTASLALADRPEPELEAMLPLLESGARTLAEARHREASALEHHRRHVELDEVSRGLRADQALVQQSLAVAESSQREADAALVGARDAHRSGEASARAVADLTQAHDLRADQLAAAAELATLTEALAAARESSQDLRDTYQRLVPGAARRARGRARRAPARRRCLPGLRVPRAPSSSHYVGARHGRRREPRRRAVAGRGATRVIGGRVGRRPDRGHDPARAPARPGGSPARRARLRTRARASPPCRPAGPCGDDPRPRGSGGARHGGRPHPDRTGIRTPRRADRGDHSPGGGGA